jgi:hypothetical protein
MHFIAIDGSGEASFQFAPLEAIQALLDNRLVNGTPTILSSLAFVLVLTQLYLAEHKNPSVITFNYFVFNNFPLGLCPANLYREGAQRKGATQCNSS